MVNVRFTSFFGDVKIQMTIIRVVPRVLNTVSGRADTVLQTSCAGQNIGFCLGAGIVRINGTKIAMRESKGAAILRTSGVLIDIKHGTGVNRIKLSGLGVRLRHDKIGMGRRVRASRPRMCTYNSVANRSVLTRATVHRDRITVGRVLNMRSGVDCSCIPKMICAGPRLTKIKGARRRLVTKKIDCQMRGLPVICSKHFVTRGRLKGKLYGLVLSRSRRVVNYRLLKGPTSRLVIITNVTVRRKCAMRRFGGDMFPRPAIKRVFRRALFT